MRHDREHDNDAASHTHRRRFALFLPPFCLIHTLIMGVHSIHIFDRRGKTLFTKRYAKSQGVNEDEEQLSEQRKLVFGMLFSLRELVGSLAPESSGKNAGIEFYVGVLSTHTSATRLTFSFPVTQVFIRFEQLLEPCTVMKQ